MGNKGNTGNMGKSVVREVDGIFAYAETASCRQASGMK
jgi:hypothetical protein